jgi:hypothetical protein
MKQSMSLSVIPDPVRHVSLLNSYKLCIVGRSKTARTENADPPFVSGKRCWREVVAS